jgi:hypothetical protein
MNKKLSAAKSEMIQNAIRRHAVLLPFVLFEKTPNIWNDPIYKVPLKSIKFSEQIKSIGNIFASKIDNSIIEALRKNAPAVSGPLNNKIFDELQNITPYTSKKYIGLTNSPKITHTIQKQPEFLYPQNYLKKGDLFYRGEMGAFGNIRIVRCGGQKRLDDIIVLGCSCIAISTHSVDSWNFFINKNDLEWHFKASIYINPRQTIRIQIEDIVC